MHHEWGRLIVVYLFLGGLSAGTLALSNVAALSGRAPRVARVGAWAAPWPVLFGTALLVLDLGQPFFFWKLLAAFQPRSPMWLGTWLLTLFTVLSVPYAALFLPPSVRRWYPDRGDVWRRRLAAAALPVAVGVGLYTGVLLSILVARPLWNTPLLAQLFLVSALSTGAAVIMLLLRGPDSAAERHLIVALDVALIAIELALIAGWLVANRTSTASASAAVGLLTRGGTGLVFWIGVVLFGLAVPLAIDAAVVFRLRTSRTWALIAEPAAAVLVLAGGLALRWVLVVAGQASHLAAQL